MFIGVILLPIGLFMHGNEYSRLPLIIMLITSMIVIGWSAQSRIHWIVPDIVCCSWFPASRVSHLPYLLAAGIDISRVCQLNLPK